MKKIVFLAMAMLLSLVSVASADFPDVRAPEAPSGYREIGNGRYNGASVDITTEEPQTMTGMPPLREIGGEPCLETEQLYYTAACVQWGEWDPLWCHMRFWCRYVMPPEDGACSGYPIKATGKWGWSDDSKPCQIAQPDDPEKPVCLDGEIAWERTTCDGDYHTTYYGYTHYCVREWWCTPNPNGVCAGLSLEMNAARRPTDESRPCQPDVPENPMCRPHAWPHIVVDCEYNPNPKFSKEPWDCTYSWWCGPIPNFRQEERVVTVTGVAIPGEWLQLYSLDKKHTFYHPFQAVDGNWALHNARIDKWGFLVCTTDARVCSSAVTSERRYWWNIDLR